MNTRKDLLLIRERYPGKIIIEDELITQPHGDRGIYGLYVKTAQGEECAYIGRSEIVSARISAHLWKIIGGTHAAAKLDQAFLDDASTIICRFVEPVEYRYDNYCRDAQRLASRECHWIDRYQSMGQCLEQLPEGRRPSKVRWQEGKAKKGKSAGGGS